MKKFIAILALVCFSATMIFAQDAKPATKGQDNKATTEVKAAKADASSAIAPTKKDGTPDLRYKANKDAAPTKKDGTPDFRYKANKEAPAKTK